jgi:hypothetical protein
VLLDSDAADFGGFGRITPWVDYFTQPHPEGSGADRLTAYLPSRTVLVFAPVTGKPAPGKPRRKSSP